MNYFLIETKLDVKYAVRVQYVFKCIFWQPPFHTLLRFL